jgi:hypothetical protein
MIPQILGLRHAGMKNRRNMNAEMQVYRANVIVGISPADSMTFS